MTATEGDQNTVEEPAFIHDSTADPVASLRSVVFVEEEDGPLLKEGAPTNSNNSTIPQRMVESFEDGLF